MGDVTEPDAFITDNDTLVEAARLTNKSHLLIRTFGGLLPGIQAERLENIHTALEIACGPGVWAYELAKAYPHIQVTGVDISQTMITYAKSMLPHQKPANITYMHIPTFLGPYPFDAASLDLISVQFVSKFLTVADWPHFLSACWQLLHSGGLLRLTEYEVSLVNSPACEELSALFIHAMRLAGRSFSVSNRHLGLLCELEPLLYAAGFREYGQVAHAVACSYGTPEYEEWKKDELIFSKKALSLIVQMGVATQEHVDALSHQQRYEMNLPTYHALTPMLTVWGTRPGVSPIDMP